MVSNFHDNKVIIIFFDRAVNHRIRPRKRTFEVLRHDNLNVYSFLVKD